RPRPLSSLGSVPTGQEHGRIVRDSRAGRGEADAHGLHSGDRRGRPPIRRERPGPALRHRGRSEASRLPEASLQLLRRGRRRSGYTAGDRRSACARGLAGGLFHLIGRPGGLLPHPSFDGCPHHQTGFGPRKDTFRPSQRAGHGRGTAFFRSYSGERDDLGRERQQPRVLDSVGGTVGAGERGGGDAALRRPRPRRGRRPQRRGRVLPPGTEFAVRDGPDLGGPVPAPGVGLRDLHLLRPGGDRQGPGRAEFLLVQPRGEDRRAGRERQPAGVHPVRVSGFPPGERGAEHADRPGGGDGRGHRQQRQTHVQTAAAGGLPRVRNLSQLRRPLSQ
ncbi:unnamed protein product, partial [Darwinula stevensoni]